MMDRIRVEGLVVHGHHGVHVEETRLGQKFVVDITCDLGAPGGAGADAYDQTVCYGRLCDIAKEVSDAGPYKIIETFSQKIADQVLAEFPSVAEVLVRIAKPSAPIAAVLDTVAVETTRKRQRAFALSLGSNMGDKATNLTLAMTLLGLDDEVQIETRSRHYRTKPWGKEDQDWFMNACVVGRTSLSPEALLKLCKETELKIGRVPGERWGPRLIDIDILTLGNLSVETLEMVLPHPEMLNRVFVLKPLAEIAPELEIAGVPVTAHLARLEGTVGEEEAMVAVED